WWSVSSLTGDWRLLSLIMFSPFTDAARPGAQVMTFLPHVQFRGFPLKWICHSRLTNPPPGPNAPHVKKVAGPFIGLALVVCVVGPAGATCFPARAIALRAGPTLRRHTVGPAGHSTAPLPTRRPSAPG